MQQDGKKKLYTFVNLIKLLLSLLVSKPKQEGEQKVSKKTNENGRNVIKHFESLRLESYYATEDEKKKGIVTIGYGTTKINGKPVPWGLKITKEQAEEYFCKDLEQFEKDVEFLVKVPISDNQFSSLISFSYNVGSDIDSDDIAEGLGDSTLLKKLNAGDYTGASLEFSKWNKQNGKVLAGLTKRREMEKRLFLTPDNQEFKII